jgi:flagellar basal-body rod protein FlgB
MVDTIQLLQRMLDVSAARHETLAANLANANTPDYKRRDLPFRETLAHAMNAQPGEAALQATVDKSAPTDSKGNSVSTSKELTHILENTLLYETCAQALSRKYAGMRKAIKGSN